VAVLGAAVTVAVLAGSPAVADPVQTVTDITDTYLGGASPGVPGAGTGVVEDNSPSGNVRASCSYVSSLPSPSFNTIRFAVHLSVTAVGLAAGVSGRCTLVDGFSTAYGSVTGAAPGNHAEGAGYIDAPRTIVSPKLCAEYLVLWLDGTTTKSLEPNCNAIV
jgi:hypothetical protein